MAAVALLLLVVFALKRAVDDPTVGIPFLFLLPIVLAALWFGRLGGLVTGLAATALYALGEAIDDAEEVLMVGTLVRGVVFCSVGVALAWLFDQQLELRRRVAEHERELAELRAVQEALVPAAVPERPGLDLATCYVPAESGAGGDFHLVIRGPSDDATVVVIGDVVGKGLQAAQRASFVRTALSSFAPYTDDPARLLELANRWLIEHSGRSETFVTVACAVFHAGARRVTWALAGHPPPIRLDAAETLNSLHPAVPLGVEHRLDATSRSVDLEPGAGLLLYTDGLLEARPHRMDGDRRANRGRPDGPDAVDQFGLERIASHLQGMRGATPRDIVNALRDAAEHHAGGLLPDDLCLVALRARG